MYAYHKGARNSSHFIAVGTLETRKPPRTKAGMYAVNAKATARPVSMNIAPNKYPIDC